MGKFKNFFSPDGGAPLIGVTSTGVPKPVAQSVEDAYGPQSDTVYQPVRQTELSRSPVAWAKTEPLGHMCCPPNVYPPGWGPGSLYVCPNCSLVWEAIGLMNRSDVYRPLVDGTKMLFGPKRWICMDGDNHGATDRVSGGRPANIELQEGLYDWRDPGEVLAEQNNEIIRLLEGR
jgi:hypothetical protein